MFLLINPNVLSESPCAFDSANEAAGKHQESAARDFDYAKSFRRRSSFLMRNAQGTCRTIFAFHGAATRPSMMAKMPVLILRVDM
jgi:hypothetical protein